MEKNIMLAFVSPVSPNSLKTPIVYKIHGESYTAIQTNESAIAYVERMLGADSIARIFLIASSFVKSGKIPTVKIEKPPLPAVTHLEFLKRRITAEFPHLADRFTEIDYSDASDSLEKNILQIAEIADAVTAYAQNFPADKIIVHAMNNFSDAIKICRTATIQDDLKNLGEQIQKFRATGSKDLKSELFAKIVDRIEAEYGDLIRGGANRFDIIRWCMHKGRL